MSARSCVLMAPIAFMQRPLRWLKAIHDYRAEITCGAEFRVRPVRQPHPRRATQGLDLSCWKVAFNGAEPVHAETHSSASRRRSRRYGFPPRARSTRCFGMAEATLLVSDGRRGEGYSTLRRSAARGLRESSRSPRRRCRRHADRSWAAARAFAGERIAIVDPEHAGGCRR